MNSFKSICEERMKKGEAKYGKYDPNTDTRDFLWEWCCEICDALNYLGMFTSYLKAHNQYDVGIENSIKKLQYSLVKTEIDYLILREKLNEKTE